MPDYTVHILQLREDNYHNGLKLGRRLRNQPILKAFEAITKSEIDTEQLKSIYNEFAPQLLSELEGLAEGLEMPLPKAAALLGGYDVPKIAAMGCSAMITPSYYVRNYDFTPAFYDGYFTMAQADQGLASAGYNLQALGRHDGVNEKGLAAGLHFVSFDGYQTGLSPWISVRMILESCATVEEASYMLRHIPHAACYNFSIGDAGGNTGVVEASPDQVITRAGEEAAIACVNHYEALTGKNRPSIEHSVRRKRYIDSLDAEQLTQTEAFGLFKEHKSPLFFTDYDDLFGTLHTFSYSFEEGRVMTSLAQGSVLDFSFRDWARGHDIQEAALTGHID
ncbi:C45 family autoproteolytic acyltransferase/hydrolase [Paenibacillus lautus]|uniref:C45 family peptidase n=1 Tax=Paenibacillus lautus TaxID=1401 RepID=UPI002DBF9757|nr:C45 family peptidase [Paenibacillus lautus]MEC0305397.1 C45 family autoproteolytic acyltransferase/hydrolase [Paenibacillus lautus]